MSSRLLAHAGRQPLRFPPRACTRKMRRHFSRQAPRCGLAPAESVPEDVAAHCFCSISGRCELRLMDASNVVGDADDAAPSRARPRLNVGPNYVRPATGQRRITARVMRSFARRLAHTLPFQAHPRVASRPKSPARCTRHTFRPSGNPTGWNRKRSVPLALRGWCIERPW